MELKHDNLKSSFTLSIAKAKHGDSSKTYENPSWLGMKKWSLNLLQALQLVVFGYSSHKYLKRIQIHHKPMSIFPDYRKISNQM